MLAVFFVEILVVSVAEVVLADQVAELDLPAAFSSSKVVETSVEGDRELKRFAWSVALHDTLSRPNRSGDDRDTERKTKRSLGASERRARDSAYAL